VNQSQLLALVCRSIPYPAQIELDPIRGENDAIRFRWRGLNFRVSDTLLVEEYGDGLLHTSPCTIMLEALLKIKMEDNP
jgi:hypothetical protein